MKTKKVPRLVYEVRFSEGRWNLFTRDELVQGYPNKRLAIFDSSTMLKVAWASLSIRSELVIKTKDGKIQDKRTYGEDPKRSKG